ncbi:class I SAM-dependent methyltransferase [Paraburkholderia gardini]|uniref:class I SAM-dependent methyltransferase n=1 Tax=Paraburkholderia gardini TaxID=2823469 RepID=UPI001DAF0608|nr:class I SAM-dependent methyltransferase [Paraburkholderia gardini]CAG4910331.1 Trans-aconitate 2-methyltransferase [Paraburkholderia gardini]
MSNVLDTHVVAYQGDNLYDFDNEILLTWYPQRILHHAGAAGSLLELGLGHGYTTDIFSRRFQRHVVLEGSPAVIRNFRDRHPDCRAQIVETYFEEFSTEERFDVIVMGFILEHVDDPLQILRRYRSFLAPGGKIFLAVPNAEVLNRKLGHLAGLLDEMTILSENDRVLGHKRYYTVSSLNAEVSEAGCHVDRLEGIYLKPLTTRQLVSLNLDRKIIDALCTVGIDYPELSCGLLAEISAR